MDIRVTIGGRYDAILERPFDISIPVCFEEPQLSAFGGAPARRAAYEAGDFVGDVRRGGSCNCEIYSFSPHLNGTHTECVGHITAARAAVHEVATENLIPATLISVAPVPAHTAQDSYMPRLRPHDMIIGQDGILRAIEGVDPLFLSALVVRTLPNDVDKKTRDYNAHPPAFFSAEAMREIVRAGVRHLLVDVPSLDRADDEGKLSCHRIFWGVRADETEIAHAVPRTVTELIYVRDDIADGRYLLNLQIAAFMADAAPSRPVLYQVRP